MEGSHHNDRHSDIPKVPQEQRPLLKEWWCTLHPLSNSSHTVCWNHWSGPRGSSWTLWSRQLEGNEKYPSKQANPYTQSFFESPHQAHLKQLSLSPNRPIYVQLLIGLLVFLKLKPLTIEGRGRRGGGFPICFSLPSHDAKVGIGQTEKNQRKKQENPRVDCIRHS